MIIAAANGSFTLPLFALAIVPPSLALPAVFLITAGFPFNIDLAASFIAVSGVSVNAALLALAELDGGAGNTQSINPRGAYRAIRRALPALLSTTETTIAGALPFLFLNESTGGLVKTLSIVSALGVGASCAGAVFLLPALQAVARKFAVRTRCKAPLHAAKPHAV